MTERGHRRPNTVLVALMLLASGITAVDQKSAAADGPEAVAADSLAVAGDPPTVVAANTPAATTPVNEGATASTEADETQATSGNEPLMPELESGGRKQAHRQSAQVVITQRMRSQLESLGYGDTDVASLHPVHAAVIVQRGLRRPIGGVPRSWMRHGGGQVRRRLSRLALGIVPAAIAVACATDMAACTRLVRNGPAALRQWGEARVIQVTGRSTRPSAHPLQRDSHQRARGLYPWDPEWRP